MQTSIVAGDTLKPSAVSLADYPAGTWTLHYRFTPLSGAGTAIEFAASASGDAHQVNVPAATSADWAPGSYTCSAWVTNVVGERFSVPSESGHITIAANPATLAAGTDTRTDAQRALAAVKALLTGKATSGVESYRINNRELRSYSVTELLKLEQRLAAEVAAEKKAAGLMDDGRTGGRRRILMRCA